MVVPSVGQVPSTAAATNASLQMEDLLKVLTTQLSFQDPMKPMDNQQFMAQMAQFSSLDQTRQTNDSLVTLLQMQSAMQSIGLIGRTVEVEGPSGQVVGAVTTVRFVEGAPAVTVKTSDGQFLADLSLNSVTVVR
jgi:flagellar basal-body rod modification protein FlgD